MLKSIKFKILFVLISTLVIVIQSVENDHPHHQIDNRDTIVHLFLWKFNDVALECERFLGPKGFGGVQISPIQEHAMVAIPNRPWWERYQPVSYLIMTASGNEADFLDMTKRCNAVGVRIYVEVVLNHMCPVHDFPIVGTGWSTANPATLDYPAVPYTKDDFNEPCEIEKWNDADHLRNCWFEGLPDLNLGKDSVRDKVIAFLNHVIELGAAGFIINSAKHIWPDDIEFIVDELDYLNVNFGFAKKSKPFIILDMADHGSSTEDIGRFEYVHIGRITEYMVTGEIGRAFRPEKNKIKWLKNWGPQWVFMPPEFAMVFVDSYRLQRDLVPGTMDTITFREPQLLRIGTIWTLANSYGSPIIMSSFNFKDTDESPPHDSLDNIISPEIATNGSCTNGWVCEHRWKSITNMVGFRNAVHGTRITRWWDNDNRHIALCRGDKGFIAFNTEGVDLEIYIYTSLPPGIYCDIITGEKINNKCTGHTVTVDDYGMAHIFISADAEDTVLAIHVESVIRWECNQINFMELVNKRFGNTNDANLKFIRMK